jgi:hypothetical protein
MSRASSASPATPSTRDRWPKNSPPSINAQPPNRRDPCPRQRFDQRRRSCRRRRLTRSQRALATKTSALGQIASHLIDGLQDPVVDLRAVVANHGNAENCTVDLRSASDYADRLQRLIATTVALLGDSGTAATDELTGTELLAIIGRRLAGPARDGTVRLTQGPGFAATLDSHRGTVSRITLAVGSSRSINVCSTSSAS